VARPRRGTHAFPKSEAGTWLEVDLRLLARPVDLWYCRSGGAWVNRTLLLPHVSMKNARQAPLLGGPVECEPDSKVARPEEGSKMRRWRYRAWRLPNGSKVVCVLDREFPPSPDYDIQWEHQTSNGRFGVDVISREQAKILLRGPRTPCEWDVDTLKGE